MKDITLHTESKTAATCVPNAFIDNFMADANGEFVKIYLYLLRCMNSAEDFSIARMADKFEHTEKDIARALKYWEKMHILKLEYDADNRLSGICLLDSNPEYEEEPDDDLTDSLSELLSGSMEHTARSTEQEAGFAVLEEASEPPAAAPMQMEAPSMIPEEEAVRPSYSSDEIMLFQQNEDVQDLMFIAEKYLGRTLNPSDINAILYWHETLHFSIDLIEYLIEYCVDKGHRSIRYMDKVAIAWADARITTVEQAKKSSGQHSQTYYGVMKAFGISGRNLVEFEMEFIDKWTKTFGFSMDIIGEACKRTIQAIHQPSFDYADSILVNWNKNHVQSLQDIAVLDSAYQKNKAAKSTIPSSRAGAAKGTAAKNRFTNYPQRSYDYAELEKQLLNSSK